MKKRIVDSLVVFTMIGMAVAGLTGCDSGKKYVQVSSTNSDGSKSELNYNEEGDITGVIQYDENGKQIFRTEIVYSEDKSERFTYSSLGEDDEEETLVLHTEDYMEKDCQRKTIILQDRTVDRIENASYPLTETYQYDEDAHLATKITTDNDGAELKIETADYYYGECYWKTSMLPKDGTYEMNDKNSFEFDKKGNLTKYIRYDLIDGNVKEEIHNTYDEYGNLIKYTKITMEMGDEKTTEEGENIYDEHGNLVKWIMDNSYYDEEGEKVTEKSITQYEYQLLSDYLKKHSQE